MHACMCGAIGASFVALRCMHAWHDDGVCSVRTSVIYYYFVALHWCAQAVCSSSPSDTQANWIDKGVVIAWMQEVPYITNCAQMNE